MNKSPFALTPEYRDYVWGGSRLRPEIVPTAEAWIIYAGNRITTGPYTGRVLSELALEFGESLLGSRAVRQTGNRFPVLVKILDCADWLSVQVHPNDEQAKQLEGEGFFGKTEAWHVLEAEQKAKLIAGMKPNISAEILANSIQKGTIAETAQTIDVQAGQTFFMKPGTIHALGPGLLIYEIQQTSDLTYRVYDWGRPQTEKRKLHIEKALAVSDPKAVTTPTPLPGLSDGVVHLLTQCEYFKLETALLEKKSLSLDTKGESFHGLTAIEGQIHVSAGNEAFMLNKFETLLIPAICGGYEIKPSSAKSRVLIASV